ncbi:MAG: TonB family protein [Myxococcaceae bacterium]|nr:TonB family protein [Myxococcaceae bacterium]
MTDASAPVPPPPPFERRRDRSVLFIAAFLVVSVVVHVVGFAGLRTYAELTKIEAPLNQPIEMVMVEVEPPKPPPPPPKEDPPPPPKPPPPRPKVRPPPIKTAEPVKPPPPPENAPPPPNEEAPKEPPKPVPLVTGISMSSTSTAGSFAAPVGNTAYGKIENTAKDPAQVQAYRAPKYVPQYQVDRRPELVKEFKIPYPPEARRNGIEGNVVLMITIDAEGNVTKVRLVSGPGYGLNEAAVEALKKFKFTPAVKNGENVSTEISYTYTFLLD